MHVFYRITPVLLLMAAVSACSKSPAEGRAGGMPPPEVTTVTVANTDVPVSYEYIGQTVGSREVEVRARVTGNIEKRLYEEGAVVRAGQPLFQLDARPFTLAVASSEAAVSTAEAKIASAEATAAQAARERDRLAPLAEAHAVSRKESDDAISSAQIATANLLSAKAELQQAKAQLQEAKLNVVYATVTAPTSGVTGRALKQEGALVSAGSDSLLTTLVQLDPLYVTFNVADEERQRRESDVAAGTLTIPKQGLNVRLLQRDGSPLGQGGHLNFASSTVSDQTGTLEMRATLANPNNTLKSGLFVKVILEGAIRPNAITVPQKAVLEGPTSKIVMVVDHDKDGKTVANPRPVGVAEWVISPNGEKAWVVTSGLKAGDAVIVDNLMKLRPGAPVSLAQAAPAAKS